MDGPISPVDCHRERPGQDCPLRGDCVFRGLWDDARLALERVYDTRTCATWWRKSGAWKLVAVEPAYEI